METYDAFWSLGNWSFRNVHGIDDAETLGYNGEGVVVGVADTGVDFCKNELRDALMRIGNLTVENATISQRTVGTLEFADLFVDGDLLWLKVYVNSTELQQALFTYDEDADMITFAPPIGDGVPVTVSYSYTPGNYGWPLVMDIGSLREYLSRNQISGDSWYANTSATGRAVGGIPPSFEYYHTPPFPMGGRKDDFNTADISFMDTNEVTHDGVFWDGEAWLSLSQVGGKDFDLSDFYVTRDFDNWYFGFGTKGAQVNKSYGLYLDFDGSAGGANIGPTGVPDPRGFPVDSEASHTSPINGLAYHPNVHGRALTASCANGVQGSSEQIIIWDQNNRPTRVLSTDTMLTGDMRAVRWSPDGTTLVASSTTHVFAWDTATWALKGATLILAAGITDHISISQNGTWAAIATGTSRFSIVDISSGTGMAHPVNVTTGGVTQSAAFSPSGDRIAVGLNDGNIQMFSSTLPPVNTLNLFCEMPGTGQGHVSGYPVRRLAWNPNGTLLATGGDDGRLFIWNAATGAIVKAWNGTAGYNPPISAEGTGAVGGLVWNPDGLFVGTGDGKIILINPDDFNIIKEMNNRYNNQITAMCGGATSDLVIVGGTDACARAVDTASSTPAALDYEAFVMHLPDVVIYAPYTAETYVIDENGDKVIGTPDGVADPFVYAWESGAWNGSRLVEDLAGQSYYKGNKQISSESEGLTETTVMGFVEISVPRSLTDAYGSEKLAVKLFVAGEGQSVAQDSVPTDNNIKFSMTDLATEQVRSLSNFGQVEFPETTIELSGITSQSGIYHYGVHPSDSLRHFIQNGQGSSGNEYVGVLVIDANQAGVYDTVVIDLNKSPDPALKTPFPNYAFDDGDPVATRENPFLALDIMDNSIYKNTSNPDGIYDYSAGLVYHISDGSPLPYSERLAELEVMNYDDEHPMPVPEAGNLVCFFGEFETYIDDTSIERVERSGTIAASAIAARGNIDDPKGYGPIAGAATGVKLAAVGRCGDHYERSLQFLAEGYDGIPGTGDDATVIYVGSTAPSYMSGLDEASHFIDYLAVDRLDGKVTFVLPAGNDGPGFGTIASPAARNALVVGASGDNAYDLSDRPEQVYGEPLQFSARGPTASGYPKPDIISTGIGRFSGPLTSYDTPGAGDENVITYRDSRVSAAIAAGAVAQFQQAYRNAHDVRPDMLTTIGAMKSSARDMGYDVLVQGSGLLDSLAAVKMAEGDGGMLVEAIDLVPSNYMAGDFRGFLGVMSAGSSVSSEVGVTNAGAGTAVDVSVERHVPVWSQTIECGVTSQYLLNLTGMLPLNVSLLRLTAWSSATDFFNPTTMNPDVIVKSAAIISDWPHDTDPFPANEDMAILCEAEMVESTSSVPTNVIELEVGQPHQKFDTNLWFVLKTVGKTVKWNVTLTGYSPEGWDWVDVSGAPASLAANEEMNIDVTATVPQDAHPGSYSGSIRVASSPEDVSEVVHTPAAGFVRQVVYEEAGITVGSVNGSLANGGILDGTLELVQNRNQTGAWESYRNGPDPADNNAIIIITDSQTLPWSIPVPSPSGIPEGTPISNVALAWAEDGGGTPSDLSDDWWEYIADNYFENNDFTIDYYTGGNITFIGNNWTGDGTVGWPSAGIEFYINYTYQVETSVQLASPADYTVDLATGAITFAAPIDASTVNVTANYTHVIGSVRRLVLDNPRITGCLQLTRFNIVAGVEEDILSADYAFSPVTGAIELDSEMPDFYVINATYSHYTKTAILPVLINVGAAQVPSYIIDGAADNAINSPGQVYGGYCYGISDFAGDRRYFYFDVPEQGLYRDKENFRSLFSLDWGGVPTDIDVSMYARDDVIMSLSGRVSPYIFKEIGKGPVSPSTKPGNFTTSSGGANETLVTTFETGMNVICLRAKLLSGETPECGFAGYGGVLSIPREEDRTLTTNKMDGNMPMGIMSNTELDKGLHASVLGPAIGKTYTAEEVYADDIFYDITQEDWWRINAGAQYIRLVDVAEGTLSLDVHIVGAEDCADLDLCLFYDGKNGQEDGIAQWDEYIDRTLCDDIDNYGWGGVGTNFKTYAYSAGAGSDEATKVLNPKPGTWLVKVVGYAVSGNPGHFDLTVKMIKEGVKGYVLSGNLEDSDAIESQVTHPAAIGRFARNELAIGWNFPGETAQDGSYSGILSVGDAYSGDLLSIPIDIILDREAPLLNDYSPKQGEYVSSSRPLIFCSFTDALRGEVDIGTIRISLDGRDVTDIAAISAPNSKNSAGVYGMWGGSAVWTPPYELADGAHMVRATAGDIAGNLIEHVWSFTIDTTLPYFNLDEDASNIYTNTAGIALTGDAEAGSDLKVLGIGECTISRDGDRFVARLSLEAGGNAVTLVSTDSAGNQRVRELNIVLDTDAPEMARLISSEGSLTDAGYTTLAGRLGERGHVRINNISTQVNSDGSFQQVVELSEGANAFDIRFTDLAGNADATVFTVTRDTLAPALSLTGVPDTVGSEWLNITGSAETGSWLSINGKPVDIAGSRQLTGSFSQAVRLSPGTNTIVVTCKDGAGNIAEEVISVDYQAPETAGINCGAIGLMALLLVLGIVLGIFLGKQFLGGRKPEDEDVPEPMPADEGPIQDEGQQEIELPADDAVDAPAPADDAATGAVDEPIKENEADATFEPKPEPGEIASDQSESAGPPGPAAGDAPPEDPRVAKLRAAYDAGKISQELYEKNLIKFQEGK